MQRTSSLVSVAVMLVVGQALSPTANAADEHKAMSAAELAWAAAPGSVPKGAQAAVLYGNPSKDGPFVLRLKLPAGYHIPPHTHPKPELVTVLSGTAQLGEGGTADKKSTKALSAGSFFAMPTGMKHYVYADQEAIIQLNGDGPWGIIYVNEKDDPRKTQ